MSLPPASQGLAHGALSALEPLPISMKTISQYIKDFTKGEIPSSVSALHTQGPHVLMFVCTCPTQRFRLGLHVQIQQLLDDVVHHADQYLSVVAEQPVVVGPHHATQHVLIVMQSTEGTPASGSPLFFSFPKHVLGHAPPQHWGFHASLANAPRIPEFRLTVLKTCGATDILLLCEQGTCQVSVDPSQREALQSSFLVTDPDRV